VNATFFAGFLFHFFFFLEEVEVLFVYGVGECEEAVDGDEDCALFGITYISEFVERAGEEFLGYFATDFVDPGMVILPRWKALDFGVDGVEVGEFFKFSGGFRAWEVRRR